MIGLHESSASILLKPAVSTAGQLTTHDPHLFSIQHIYSLFSTSHPMGCLEKMIDVGGECICPLVETRGFKMLDVREAGYVIGLDVFLVDASNILKPPISMGGLNKPTTHI